MASRDGLAGRGGRLVATLVGEPCPGPELVDQRREDPALAHRRDRLDREHVGAGVEERLHARSVEIAQRLVARVVVAAVLRPVGEHRPVRSDGPGDQQLALGSTHPLGEAVARPSRDLDGSSDGAERRCPIQAGRGKPGNVAW